MACEINQLSLKTFLAAIAYKFHSIKKATIRKINCWENTGNSIFITTPISLKSSLFINAASLHKCPRLFYKCTHPAPTDVNIV